MFYFCVVTLKIHAFGTVSWVNACLQHRILGFVNRATVRQHLALLHQFGICDHQESSSEGWKDESHLVPRPHNIQQKAALLQQFWWMCLKHPVAWHQVTFIFSVLWRSLLVVSDSKMLQKCNWQWFCSQCPRILYWQHMHSYHKWQVPELSGWLCGRVGHCCILWEMLPWIKSCWISRYSLCITF